MKKLIKIALCALCAGCFITAPAQNIHTIAGSGVHGFSGDNGAATAAHLSYPNYVTLDAAGNVYISEAVNQRIRKITPAGVITTIAGTGVAFYSGDGGPATGATLNYPAGIAVDNNGSLYIVDGSNHCIRKVDPAGIIHTIAGNGASGYSGDGLPSTASTLFIPSDVAVDASGNVYIADNGNSVIRKIQAGTGIITTIAGTGTMGSSGDGGPATSATLNSVRGITVDRSGNIYLADEYAYQIREITAATGIISLVAGNGIFGFSGDGGPAINASMNPADVAVDTFGNIYLSDHTNNRIRKVDATGTITTIAGTGAPGYNGDEIPATSAQLNLPMGVFVDKEANIYVADQTNDRVRMIDHLPNTAAVTDETAAGYGLNVYPNPGDGNFTVHINAATSGMTEIAITDVAGRSVQSLKAMTNEAVHIQLVAKGIYVLAVQQDGHKIAQRMLIVN